MTINSLALQGLRVLVTRPRAQGQSLCQLIEQSGGEALHYPMLELQATPDDPSIAHTQQQLTGYDYIMFISANAVQFGLSALDNLPRSAAICCVGSATAAALAAQGYADTLQPLSDFSSEGLLNLPQLQQLQNKKALIVRGRGGRELLKQELEKRGAAVDYMECYQRLQPQLDYQPLNQAIRMQQIDIISCSSNQALQHLLQVAPMPELFDTHFLPISPNMAAKAKDLGFLNIINTANNASDGAILDALRQFSAKN